MSTFGEKLRELRERTGKTQEDLAGEKVQGKKRTTFGQYVSRIELGYEKNPSLSMIVSLAAGFGCSSLSEFFALLENKSLRTDNAVPLSGLPSGTTQTDRPEPLKGLETHARPRPDAGISSSAIKADVLRTLGTIILTAAADTHEATDTHSAVHRPRKRRRGKG